MMGRARMRVVKARPVCALRPTNEPASDWGRTVPWKINRRFSLVDNRRYATLLDQVRRAQLLHWDVRRTAEDFVPAR